MLDVQAIKTQDLAGLSPGEWAEVAGQLLAHIGEQSKHIVEQSKRIDSQLQAIKWRDAKIESITFQLARLKAWKFGAKTERMNAQQREIFEETLAADQASLETQLAALQAQAGSRPAPPDKEPRRQPKREPLPAHLARVEQRVEPEDTTCPTQGCGQAMVRVGEDISERLANSAGAILRAAPDSRQVGLPVLPVAGAGAGGGPGVRERHAHAGAAGPHGDQPLRRSPALLPARTDQRALGGAHAALDAGGLGRADRCAADAVV